MSIAALILAAGASNRMGTSKALLGFRGKTFVEAIVGTLRDAAITDIVVAISRYDDKIKQLDGLQGVPTVLNADPETAGPLGSIRAGLVRIINQAVEYCIVWPVDQPHVLLRSILALKSLSESEEVEILVPTYQGRRGHPVIFGRAVFNELIDAPDEQGAKYVVRRVPERVLEVPVDDAAVVQDIDTPEDYQRLISSTKSLL